MNVKPLDPVHPRATLFVFMVVEGRGQIFSRLLQQIDSAAMYVTAGREGPAAFPAFAMTVLQPIAMSQAMPATSPTRIESPLLHLRVVLFNSLRDVKPGQVIRPLLARYY